MANTTKDVLEQFKNGTISIEEVQAQLHTIQVAERKTLTYKVSPKGGISFYGIRKMPITLYQEELQRIVEVVNGPEFKEFIASNVDKLSTKEKPVTQQPAAAAKAPIKLNIVS